MKIEPDWSKAPDWAHYWAVDSNGHAYWYEHKPQRLYFDDFGFGNGDWKEGDGIWFHTSKEPNKWNNTGMPDYNWPPEGVDNKNIDWGNTLLERP